MIQRTGPRRDLAGPKFLDRVVTGLRDSDDPSGQDGPGSGFGIDEVVLAVESTVEYLRPTGLDVPDASLAR